MSNIILYGPPGTGKTYRLQQLKDKYLDYKFSHQLIIEAYRNTGDFWLVICMALLNNRNRGTIVDIINALKEVSIQTSGVNTELIKHNIKDDTLGNNKEPRIFEEYSENGDFLWKVNISAIDKSIYEKYFKKGEVNRYEFVTFHQSFAYENFIEGIRPQVVNGQVEYSIVNGIFKDICDLAKMNITQKYAIFIDEINRGNIAEIFGETISLIELDKRLGKENELLVTLPYSKEKFGVPENLDIYGTMNSADKSTTSLDMALRRRFEFKKIEESRSTLVKAYQNKGADATNIDGINIVKLVEMLNDRIELLLDENYKLGSAYFIGLVTILDIIEVLKIKIIPLLEEYFFDDLEKIQMLFNDLDENGELKENAIYQHKILEPSNLFCYIGENDIEERKRFLISKTISFESIKKIYE